MGRTKRALAGLERWSLVRPRALFVLVAASMATPAGMVRAAQDADCNAVNRGTLNIELESDAVAIRQVALKSGDKLTFSFEAANAGPFGTVTLRQGAGAPRSLLVGPTGTSVSFVAAGKGTFDFEFAKEGTEAAAFAVSCVPAGNARRRSMPTAAAARRSAKLLGGSLPAPDDIDIAQLAGVVLDSGIPAPSSRKHKPWEDDTQPGSAEVPAPGSHLDMKMEWRGERYRAVGPQGLESDHSASGVNAALNYKLLPDIMVGALAQVDQPGETLIGAPLSFSDQGWMVGPVTKVTLAHGLSLDARAAWGVAETAADELAARAISSSRRMISARLANTQAFGPWRFSPSVSVNHFQAAGTAPTAETHEMAAPAGASFGRVDVGPEIAYRIDLDKSAFIEPRAVIGSFWEIDSLSKLGPGSAGHGDMRLKAEAGVTIGATDGAKVQATGGVEEGAPGAADVWSGRVQFSVPMK